MGPARPPNRPRAPRCASPPTCPPLKLVQVEYPEIEEGSRPRHRFMSAYEQRVETADKTFQYLIFAAEPYENISFKIPNQVGEWRGMACVRRLAGWPAGQAAGCLLASLAQHMCVHDRACVMDAGRGLGLGLGRMRPCRSGAAVTR